MLKAKDAYQILAAALSELYAEREAHTIAQYVLEDLFGLQQVNYPNYSLSEQQKEQFQQVKKQLEQAVPWQYVVGTADFYGRKFIVNEAVLIPRAETEELVYWVIEEYRQQAVTILDIGTGSGCIALSLQKEIPTATVTAIDISEAALQVAQNNAHRCDTTIHTQKIDILKEKKWKQLSTFDVIVSNPPYIPQEEREKMPRHVLDYEPSLALFVANNDTLLFYEKIADFALKHLAEGGSLFFEVNEFYGQAVVKLLQERGFLQIELRKDMSGRDRMIRAQLS